MDQSNVAIDGEGEQKRFWESESPILRLLEPRQWFVIRDSDSPILRF